MTTPRTETSLLIIADDLSGAADSAIAFADAGRYTMVTLDAERTARDATISDVIAVDTDTRRLSASAAARRTANAYRALMSSGRLLCKKMDSTLRGNWAAEVAALQPLAGLAIVAPSFPATGRTMHRAQIHVHGEPLESTDTWQLEHAGRAANVQTMLEDAGLRCECIEVEVLRGDAAALRRRIIAAVEHAHSTHGANTHALIFDAHTSDDLRRLAAMTSAIVSDLLRGSSTQQAAPTSTNAANASNPAAPPPSLFWVGSGGLSRELAALPDLFQTPAAVPAPHSHHQGAILTLVGSLSAVSVRQCALLREVAGLPELIIPPSVLRIGAAHPEWDGWQTKINEALAQATDILVRIGRDDAFDPAEGAHLSTSLAALVAPSFGLIGGLIVTGGETARAMLSAAEIGSIDLLAEVEAGVAVARPSTPHPRQPAIVTKAGAFGSEHALLHAYRHIQNMIDAATQSTGVTNEVPREPTIAASKAVATKTAPSTATSASANTGHGPQQTVFQEPS